MTQASFRSLAAALFRSLAAALFRSLAAALFRSLAAALLLVVLASCSSGTQTQAEPSPEATGGLNVQVASYDLAVGSQRFMVGLITSEQELVGWGDVDLRFAYLGTREEQVRGEVVSEATGRYLPIPNSSGQGPQAGQGPTVVPGAEGSGVYAAEVDFDRAGFWGVEVTADLDGDVQAGTATFEVFDEHRYPAVGDEAPRTENLTLDSTDVPREAIDSRAGQESGIPDEHLHTTTVASSIAGGKPTLLIVSTPVYCLSRFCGPITDMVAQLAHDYSAAANFIHIEVWRDFDNSVVNEAAAEWVMRDQNIFEPWVFLIDEQGIISHRWDNVATRAEIEPVLQDL
ncbi:MAG: hypothetical protein WD602_09905 [Actinomycetota bacterium]